MTYEDGRAAVAATPDNTIHGDYPLGRFLYVYVNKRPREKLPPLEEEFLKLVLSKQGQEIVGKDGYVPRVRGWPSANCASCNRPASDHPEQEHVMASGALTRMRAGRRAVNSLTTRIVQLGGAGVIGAIALIFLYLLWVIAPIFESADIGPAERIDLPAGQPAPVKANESDDVGLRIDADGTVYFFDLASGDIFLVQDEICKNIMVALQVKLTVGESARTVADTVSIKAYEKFLKGTEHLLLRSKENVLVARQLAQEAIAIDPKYAAAYVLVGWSYLDEVWFGMTKTPEESIANAEEMAQKAISIHGVKGEENSLLSSVNLLKKDLEKAIFYAEKALEQRPNSAVDHFILGMALRYNGQYDEAISRFKKALQLNPVKPLNYLNNLAWAYLFSRQYEKAIPIWNETLGRNPDYLFAI